MELVEHFAKTVKDHKLFKVQNYELEKVCVHFPGGTIL